jgi:hypothetical protein
MKSGESTTETVQFETLFKLGPTEFLAYGSVDVRFTRQRGDRDIGEPDWYWELDFPATITATLEDEDGFDVLEVEIRAGEPLYSELVRRFEDSCLEPKNY